MIDASSVYLLLQKIFRNGHPDPSHQEPRNTILIGHSVDRDIASLQKVTERTWSFQDFPYVLLFETQLLRRDMLGGPTHKRLELVLIKLQIPYKFLHNGGNDSNFTMKALLALALWDCPFNKHLSPEMLQRKKILRALAQMPMPPQITGHLEPIPFDPLLEVLIVSSTLVDCGATEVLIEPPTSVNEEKTEVLLSSASSMCKSKMANTL
jgi:hypothetical protein